MSTAASRAWCRTRRRAGVGAVTLKDLLIGSTPVCLEVAVLVLVVRVVTGGAWWSSGEPQGLVPARS